MEFEIDTANVLKIKDIEISELLTQVYVGDGFIEQLRGNCTVRAICCSRTRNSNWRSGTTFKFGWHGYSRTPRFPSPTFDEKQGGGNSPISCKTEYRRRGIGRMLVESAINKAKSIGSIFGLIFLKKSIN